MDTCDFVGFSRVDVDGGLKGDVHFARTLQVHLADVSPQVRTEGERPAAQSTQVISILGHFHRTDRLYTKR